ncbi:MAG TPA: SDR family NAD(P)-dependent oxidoreductase [Baekduia sp.]
MHRLDGKVAVVTGGAGGIGRGVAEAMAAEGAQVVIGDLSPEASEEVAAGIEAAGGHAIGRVVDVTDRASVEALVADAERVYGVPNVLFTSAGIAGAGGQLGFLEIDDDTFLKVMDVNVHGTFLVAQVVARRLVAAEKPGSIITVASTGASRPMVGAPAYHTSKGAIVSMTRALAVNLAQYGIRTNAVAPGFTMSEMMKPLLENEERHRQLLGRISLSRFGSPADIGHAAVFLASDESSYITGEVLHVDGGVVVHGWLPSSAPLRHTVEGEPAPVVPGAEPVAS